MYIHFGFEPFSTHNFRQYIRINVSKTEYKNRIKNEEWRKKKEQQQPTTKKTAKIRRECPWYSFTAWKRQIQMCYLAFQLNSIQFNASRCFARSLSSFFLFVLFIVVPLFNYSSDFVFSLFLYRSFFFGSFCCLIRDFYYYQNRFLRIWFFVRTNTYDVWFNWILVSYVLL